MFAKLTRTVFTVAVLGSLSVLAASASAQTVRYRPTVPPGGYPQRVAPYVQPPVVPHTPRLGFYGQMHYGWGMMVVSVTPGSLASRNGLESGDVILEINGRPVQSDHDYRQALREAVFQGGYVQLLVDNVRARQGGWGQRYVRVGFYLNEGVGPVVYRSATP